MADIPEDLGAYTGIRRVTDLEHRLASAFAGVLRGWLDDGKWEHVLLSNVDHLRDRISMDEDGGGGSCASHDVCDSNMAMDAAFRLVMGREARMVYRVGDAGMEHDAACDARLWNRAWAVALELYLVDRKTLAALG